MKKAWALALSSLLFIVQGCAVQDDAPQTTDVIFTYDPDGDVGPDSPSCKAFIAKLPTEYFHDFITVPQDPNHPNGTQIQVFYYGQKVPGQTPVAFFNGGPTANSRGDYQVLQKTQQAHPEYASIPFIFIDQRGTGCSSPYPMLQNIQDELSLLRLYGSVGIISDAEAIRKHLFNDQPWKIFGQSYGGIIVHRYFTLAPDSIVSATSHGFALTDDAMDTLTSRIDSQNRVLQTYLAEYPDDEKSLMLVDQQLSPSTCFSPTNGKGKACGKSILEPFYSTLGFLDQWPWIHKQLEYFSQHQGVTQAWADKILFQSGVVGSSVAGLADEVIWHDEMQSAPGTPQNCAEVFQRLRAKGEDPDHWLLNECQAAIDSTAQASPIDDAIYALPQHILDISQFKTSLVAHPQLPFYLYSGGQDPYSPVETFQAELASVQSLLHYFNFPNSGHDGFYSEDLVWKNLALPLLK